MIIDILIVIVGLALILWGASALTDGASAIARRFGVSDLIIGLTVVAFGTSMPEFVISLISAIKGNAGIAIGNIVGSNIANVLLIIGLTALVRPMPVTRSLIFSDIPLVVLSAVVLAVMGNAPVLDGSPEAILTRVDGILLLIFCIIFIRYTFSQAKSGTMAEEESTSSEMKLPKALLLLIGGLAALIFGGDRFVAAATSIASHLGVSDAIIGLTIVAIGTSLPELATSVAAALKGKPGLAIGNVIGSNVLNIFFILGCSATVRELPFGAISNVDLGVMVASCCMFWFFARFFRNNTISRGEGAILLAAYLAYMSYLVVNS